MTGPEIGAAGVLGIAFETTPNTYQAPTKFIPIRNESLKLVENVIERRVIRGIADVVGTLPGNAHVEGVIEIECTEDILPYFLRAGRWNVVKTGTTPNWVYTATPTHQAIPAFTISITVVRAGIVFGYVGCVATSFEFSKDNGLLVCKITLMGVTEAVQSAPTAVYTQNNAFGPGMYINSIGGSQVFDSDTVTVKIDDGGVVEMRDKNVLGAQFVRFGQRAIEVDMMRDFIDRTNYGLYLAQTAQVVDLLASRGTNNSIDMVFPVATMTDYQIGLSGQGDLIRATIKYIGSYDYGTSKATAITCKTQEVVF